MRLAGNEPKTASNNKTIQRVDDLLDSSMTKFVLIQIMKNLILNSFF